MDFGVYYHTKCNVYAYKRDEWLKCRLSPNIILTHKLFKTVKMQTVIVRTSFFDSISPFYK